MKRWLGELFKRYDEETQQWLLQDIRDWPRDIRDWPRETEADEGGVELPGLDDFLKIILVILIFIFLEIQKNEPSEASEDLSVLAGPVTASSQPKGMVL